MRAEAKRVDVARSPFNVAPSIQGHSPPQQQRDSYLVQVLKTTHTRSDENNNKFRDPCLMIGEMTCV